MWPSWRLGRQTPQLSTFGIVSAHFVRYIRNWSPRLHPHSSRNVGCFDWRNYFNNDPMSLHGSGGLSQITTSFCKFNTRQDFLSKGMTLMAKNYTDFKQSAIIVYNILDVFDYRNAKVSITSFYCIQIYKIQRTELTCHALSNVPFTKLYKWHTNILIITVWPSLSWSVYADFPTFLSACKYICGNGHQRKDKYDRLNHTIYL